jgi:integrase
VSIQTGKIEHIRAGEGGELGRNLGLNFDYSLQAANDRLRFSRLGVTIEQVGDRLVLRATLPPKPGTKRRPYQQRLHIGYRANAAGLKQAEKQAQRLGADLSGKTFDWRNWGWEPELEGKPIADWVAKFESEWWRKNQRDKKSESTLHSNYVRHFRRLPQDVVLDEFVLTSTIESLTEPNTRTRRGMVLAYQRLCKFAGLAIDLSEWRGDYSPEKVSPRDLPSDAEIAATRATIKDDWWRWSFGVMAAYGLRNHEIFHLDLSDFPKLRVLDAAKTGYRVVRPLYPEWAEEWGLQHEPQRKFKDEKINAASNTKLGSWINRGMKNREILKPYNLRHCYARRCREFLVPVTLAARMMGHSVAVHESTYSKWITEADDDRLIAALTGRVDRPKCLEQTPPPRQADLTPTGTLDFC